VDQRRRRFQPLTLAIYGFALAAIVGISVFLGIKIVRDEQEPLARTQADWTSNLMAPAKGWLDVRPVPRPPVAKRTPPAAVTPPPAAAPVRATGFQFVDARPPKDKMDFDPGDGSLVAGDRQFVPDRVSLLRERLASKAGGRLTGKRVEVRQLVSFYVRTPKEKLVPRGPGLAPLPAEKYFDLPQLRQFPYWVVCIVGVSVDGHYLRARGIEGFAGPQADFAAHHQRALLRAVDQVIAGL